MLSYVSRTLSVAEARDGFAEKDRTSDSWKHRGKTPNFSLSALQRSTSLWLLNSEFVE